MGEKPGGNWLAGLAKGWFAGANRWTGTGGGLFAGGGLDAGYRGWYN